MKFSVATAVLALAAVTSALPMGTEVNQLDARELMDNEIQIRENGDVVMATRELSEYFDQRDFEGDSFETRDLLEARKGGGGIADVLEMAITGFINLAKGIKQDKIVRFGILLSPSSPHN